MNPIKSDTSEENTDIGNILYEFTTPEFEKQERGQVWLIVFGLCVISGVVIGIFTHSLSIVLLSIMLGFVYTITYNQKPNDIQVVFSDIGMVWKNKFFSYQEIEKFWIFFIPYQHKTLHVCIRKGRFDKEIIIPIQSQKISKIRETLGYYVPEDENSQESMKNMLTRKLKL